VTGATLARTSSITKDACEIPHVLDGVILDGAAGRLGRMLDRGFLNEAGWDPRTRVLSLPTQHRLLGRRVCRAGGCVRTVHSGLPAVCHRCFTRLTGLGMNAADIAAAPVLPAVTPRADHCAVSGCQCVPTVRHAVLCEPHAKKFRLRRPPMSMEQFLADPRVRPLPPMPACQVAACTRASDGAGGYCNTHYQRWRTAQHTTPELDHRWWQVRESAGNRIWRDAHALLDSEHARYAVGEVAVPYGICTEPSNVQAGGGACPVRFRCAGCDHFRTNVAFLPDLQAYLDDLLRTRERLAATVDGVDEWARADATPTEEEITRIRRLINRITGDIAGLDEAERTQIDDAVAVVRRHRAAHAVPLGMPAIRAAAPAPPTTTTSETIA
jgi:hypothetical protein